MGRRLYECNRINRALLLHHKNLFYCQKIHDTLGFMFKFSVITFDRLHEIGLCLKI